jgi:hypothetical protein
MVGTPPVRRHIQIGTETAAFTRKETFGVDANSRLESDDARQHADQPCRER